MSRRWTAWREQKARAYRPPDADWRLVREEEWMYGARLRWKPFHAPTPDWDHEHCALCWATFMDADEPDVLREGYAWSSGAPAQPVLPLEERTIRLEGSRLVRAPWSEDEAWVCAQCFADFGARFGWSAVSEQER